MVFKGKEGVTNGSDVISLGMETWNIADGFTKFKILRLLMELDYDEEIAMFGKRDDLQMQISPEMIPQNRVEAFEKMIFHLRQLIGNCRFSIEKGFDEKLINNFLDRLDIVENYSDGIAEYKKNYVTKEESIVINEEHFRKSFTILRDIKMELNFPINRAGLIFRQSEEMDLDKIMNDIIEGG
jgi:hypothetical protein